MNDDEAREALGRAGLGEAADTGRRLMDLAALVAGLADILRRNDCRYDPADLLDAMLRMQALARLDRLAAAVEGLAPTGLPEAPVLDTGAGCAGGCRCADPDAETLSAVRELAADRDAAMVARDAAEEARAATARRLDAVALLVGAVPPPSNTAHTADCWTTDAACLAMGVRRVLASGDPATLADGLLAELAGAAGGAP